MAAKVTQRDRVLQYIQDFGSITSWEAYREQGITQLGARIFELKERGYSFNTERVNTENRYGDRTHFDRYTLAG
ncbi:MAG: helix-turn-helix domain-containing protein [Eubacterium sp.]|nr:helix-turn-helix domain-containing protein [Eubacterium sp.]